MKRISLFDQQKQQQNYTSEKYTQDDPYESFLYALKASETKRQYPKRLKIVFDYLLSINELKEDQLEKQCKEVVYKTLQNPHWLTSSLMKFIIFQKERIKNKEIVAITANNYIRSFKLFIDMNFDMPPINWKKITRGLPSGREIANDRAPTIEEIQTIIEYPDRRIKPLILCMVSGGFRLGAWDYLKWKHVVPLENKEGEIIAAKLIIYANEPEEYFCFITLEAYNALKNWMDYRSESGEEITGESWLMRNMWQTTEFIYGAKWGLVKYPKKLESIGLKSLIERAIKSQGIIKKPLVENEKRREWKSVHGYRKFFKSHAEQVMKPIHVEMLLGHNIGLSGSYYKPTEKQILEDYLKAIDFLTINENNKFSKKIKELEEKTQYEDYFIRGKLQEKDEQIKSMKENYDEELKILKEAILDMQELMKYPRKLSEIYGKS
jgi:integrase